MNNSNNGIRSPGRFVRTQHPRPCKRKPCTNQLRSRFEARPLSQGMEEPQRSTSPPSKPVQPQSGRTSSKVSQIANRFQTMGPEKPDPSTGTVTTNNTRNNESGAPVTESHATRFNNARALFEKLGEQDTTKPIIPNKAEKLVVNTQLKSIPRSTNGHNGNIDINNDITTTTSSTRTQDVSSKITTTTTTSTGIHHPVKPPKPDKPERKFSSKELIEKQRNWTAHFKNRTSSSPRSSFDKPQQSPIRSPLPPSITPIPVNVITTPTSPLKDKSLVVTIQPTEEKLLSTSLNEEKQEREEQEKRPSETPPSPVSPIHVSHPTAVSPTPSGTESSADSVTQDVEKTLSDLSEPSPILATNNVQQESTPIIISNTDNNITKSSPTKEINQNIESIDNKIDNEEQEIESLIHAHDKRKKVSVQLVLSSPESPVPPSQFGNQIIERDDDEKDIDISPQEPRESTAEVENIQKTLDLNDVKFVDAEEEEGEIEEEDSSSEISPEPSEETVSSVPSKDLSSPDNETPPTLPPKDMSPEVESLPPLPLSEVPTTLNIISNPPRKPLPPSPIEEKLPELPENSFMARTIPPKLPEKDFGFKSSALIPEKEFMAKEIQKPLPPLPRREIPEFVESPPPLPPKDIPEDAIPVTVRMIGEPESMTKDEEENLLSTRQEALLSDEEAQEVHRLLEDSNSEPITAELQPSLPATIDQIDEGEGTAPASPSLAEDSITQPSDSTLLEATLDYRDRADISLTLEGSLSAGSQSETDSAGLLGSATSLTDQTITIEQTEPTTNYVAIPCREVFVENGVHYLEDGHFWVEVPGLPESDEDEEELDENVTIHPPTRVSFSAGPMRMYSTHSVSDYDRRNEDVDPVAASAEYELEKRVEKMDVFPVELLKGPEGLGLSIIGMGVGADAGLEKLGIFVKTITDQGAAARDSRIQVNDQIIEVDGKSLVGVTQAYAASVLRNTSGLVKFLIGREKDPENSEVAQLIKQSLQADKERDEHRRQMHDGMTSPGDMSGGDVPQSPDVVGTPPAPPPHRSASSTSHPQYTSADLEAMRQVVKESQYKLAVADADIARLKQRLAEQERAGGEEVSEKIRAASQRLREMERGLQAAKKEVAAYQDMLEQSQGQYIALEKKYSKAKKLLKEFQEREKDLLHREEFHLQLLQEKDTEYNALVKTLKDRIIQLEQELLETQKQAGLAQQLPYDGSSIRQLTPQMGRKQQAPPVKPLLQQLDTELSDTEISDCSPEDTDKTSTVERKVPVKEELDRAVPPHELLDVSASKARVDLVKGGALAGRQLPTPSKKSPISSSSSDYGLDNYSAAEEEDESIKIVTETSSTSVQSHVTMLERPGSLPMHQPIYQRTTYSSSHQDVGLSSMQAVYVSRSSYGPTPPRSGIGPPPSLAEQLKQVLAERERRISSGEQRDVEEHKPSTISQTLVEEIRQAVQEANARVKRVPTVLDSPPSSLSSSCSSVSPALRPSSAMDSRSNLTDPGSPEAVWLSQELLPQCTPLPHEKRSSTSHFWHSAPVSHWSKEQVCQWLLALGLEQHIPRFMEQNVTGPELLMLESKEMKSLGVGGDDKTRLKRKLKELRVQEERERKQMEKEKKEKEKLQKKAEKLAEKASKIKK